MPRGDGTGPMGMGPMTGRALGYCAGAGGPGAVGLGRGRASGRGFGRRLMRGPGTCFWTRRWASSAALSSAWQISREEELEYLRGQAGVLQQELDAISGRIGRLEAEAASGPVEEE